MDPMVRLTHNPSLPTMVHHNLEQQTTANLLEQHDITIVVLHEMLKIEDRLSSFPPHPVPCASTNTKTELAMAPNVMM